MMHTLNLSIKVNGIWGMYSGASQGPSDKSVGAFALMVPVLPMPLTPVQYIQRTSPVACAKNTSVKWRPLDMTM